MKNIFLLAAALVCTLFASAREDTAQKKPKFSFELSTLVGTAGQNIKTGDRGKYRNTAVYNPGTINYTGGNTLGAGIQGYWYPLKSKRFSVGSGLLYSAATGDLALSGFHVEYQETDAHGMPFRQLVTATMLREAMTMSNISIPLTVRSELPVSKQLTFSLEGGILFNVSNQTHYNTTALFDYEAIYKFTPGSSVYDGAPVPDATDWFLTRANTQVMGGSNAVSFFDSMRVRGYNVALDVKPGNGSGKMTAKQSSIGFLIRPAIAVNFTDNIALSLGGYFMEQTFTHTPAENYRMMNINGTYSSPLQTVTSVTSTSYGVTLAFRYTLKR